MLLGQQAPKRKLSRQRLVEPMKLFCTLIKTLFKKSTESREVPESTSFMMGLGRRLFLKASCVYKGTCVYHNDDQHSEKKITTDLKKNTNNASCENRAQ